ncbi:MAG: helicase [Candidatus Competibacteraceae bacterium]|nr:helicase [Candidatus Competibacteraceae bacterium]
MIDYQQFLASKRRMFGECGFEPDTLNKKLFAFQTRIVETALRKGRYAIFADCGMGKTLMQLEWARRVSERENRPVLTVTPLAVSAQTFDEAQRFGYMAEFSRRPNMTTPIQITNYSNIEHFEPSSFAGLVIDESSILKGDGPMRRSMQAFADRIKYRLACTATPAPNDFTELGNHSEFVGSLSHSEMLATYFVHDGGDTSKWRLKGHAKQDFWRWVASWAMFCSKPSDLGFDDKGYNLPALTYHQHEVGAGFDAGLLFDVEAESLSERRAARKDSIEDRCAKAADMVNASDESWVVWCNLNAESEKLASLIPDAIEVTGSDSDEHKADAMIGFAQGKHRVIVTKPSIAGWGMNWQHCRNQVFVGLSDSWEQLYQAVRRSWRFGQQKEVHIHIVTSKAEGAVVRNIERKDKQAKELMNELSAIARSIYVSN